MPMNHHTDQQLALKWIRKLKGFTTVLVVFMAFVSIAVNSQGLFSAEFGDPMIQQLSFDLRNPLREFGITILTSIIVHFSFSHFISNCIWLLPFGLFLEHTRSIKMLLIAGLSGHLVSLAFSWAQFTSEMPHFVLGASAFTLSTIGFTAAIEKKLFLYMLSGIIIVTLPTLDQEPWAHIMAMATGSLLGIVFSKKTKKTSK